MQCRCLANIDLDHNFEYKIIVAIPILIWEREFSEKWVHVVYFKSHLPQAAKKSTGILKWRCFDAILPDIFMMRIHA